MRRLFVLICGLILYGSFYPWEFHFGGSLWLAVLRVFHDWPQQLTASILKDMALNVVVYIPLGLTAYLSGAPGFRWTRALWPIAFGFALSLFVESLQSFLVRSPSGMDLLCNTLGSAAGVAIAAAYESAISRWFERLTHSAMRPSSALMMLIIFVGHYAMPLSTNSIRLLTTYHRPPMLPQHWDWTEFGNSLAAWLLASRLAEAVAGKLRWAFPSMLAALVVALLSRAVSPNLLFTWPMLAGAVIGVAIWKVFESTAPPSPSRGEGRLYALLALSWLVADGLRPYTFIAHQSFDWIPFRAMLGVDWTDAITSLLSKAWMYGAAFWMWERAGLSRPRALAALLLVLAAIEFAQMYLPGRVSTMTDLAMGAIAAGLLWSIELKYGAGSGIE